MAAYTKTIADYDVTTGDIASSANVTSVAITTGASAFFGSGWPGAGDTELDGGAASSIGTISIVNGNESEVNVSIYSFVGIGAVSITTGTSYDTNEGVDVNLDAAAGAIGTIKLVAVGEAASAYLTASAAGAIGAITLIGTGSENYMDVHASAGSGAVGAVSYTLNGASGELWLDIRTNSGNVGAITVNATGESAYVSAYVDVSGNVGAITINQTGEKAYIDTQIYANATADSASAGSIGNITIKQIGESAYFSGYFDADENIGNISVILKGDNASGTFSAFASGNIGTVNINIDGYSAYMSAYISAGGSVGNVTVTLSGDSAGTYEGELEVEAGTNIGNVTLNQVGTDTYISAWVSAGGNIGNVSLTQTGDNSSASVNFSAGDPGTTSGNIGNISIIKTGDSGWVSAYFESDGNIGNITVKATGASGDTDIDVYAFSGNIGAVSLTNNGFSAFMSAYVSADGNIASITIKQDGTYASGEFSAYAGWNDGSGNIGNISIVNSGTSAYVSGFFEASGTIGNITASVTGYSANIDLDVSAFGSAGGGAGSIGTINLSATGTSAYISGYFEASGHVGLTTLTAAGHSAGVDVEVYTYGGNIAGINAKAIGESAFLSGYFYAEGAAGPAGAVGGSIGNIALTVAGRYASGEIDVDTYAYVSGLMGGGNIGAISLSVKGDRASGYMDASANEGGDILSINATVAGYSAYGEIYVEVDGEPGKIAKIGNAVITVNNTNNAYGNAYYQADAWSGNILNTTMTVTGGLSGSISAYLTATDAAFIGMGGNIGNITMINKSYAGDTYLEVYADTKVGNLTVEIGGGSAEFSGYIDLDDSFGADMGAVSIKLAATNNDSSFLRIDGDSADSDLGLITITGGGKNSSFNLDGWVNGSVEAKSIVGVNASLFNGTTTIDLADVVNGTTIKGGTNDDDITGTLGDDIITGGLGDDDISGNDGDDIINGGAGADIITGGDGADIMKGDADTDRFIIGAGDSDAVQASWTDTAGGSTIDVSGMDIITVVNGDNDVIDFDAMINLDVVTAYNAVVTQVTTGATVGQTEDFTTYTGTYSSITNLFTSTASASATALLLVYDTNGDGGGAIYQAVVLVGVTALAVDLGTGVVTV